MCNCFDLMRAYSLRYGCVIEVRLGQLRHRDPEPTDFVCRLCGSVYRITYTVARTA